MSSTSQPLPLPGSQRLNVGVLTATPVLTVKPVPPVSTLPLATVSVTDRDLYVSVDIYVPSAERKFNLAEVNTTRIFLQSSGDFMLSNILSLYPTSSFCKNRAVYWIRVYIYTCNYASAHMSVAVSWWLRCTNAICSVPAMSFIHTVSHTLNTREFCPRCVGEYMVLSILEVAGGC